MVATHICTQEGVSRKPCDVRFGSKADIGSSPVDVRYSPKSGHGRQTVGRPLCSNSGHRDDYCECHTGGAFAMSFGQTVTSSRLRHWTMIGTKRVLRPV
jgi:hypothetical protein